MVQVPVAPTGLTGIVHNTTTNPVTSFSFAPPANALMFVVFAVQGSRNASAATGASMTTTVNIIDTPLRNSSGANSSNGTALHIWTMVTSATPGTLCTVTATAPAAPTSSSLFVFFIESGFEPLAPISAAGYQVGATTTMTCTYGSYTSLDRVVMVTASRAKTTAQTPGAGFTTFVNDFGASPTIAVIVEHRTGTGGNTASTSGAGTSSNASVALTVGMGPDPVVTGPWADAFLWDGSTMIEGDLFQWDGTTLNPLDVHSQV